VADNGVARKSRCAGRGGALWSAPRRGSKGRKLMSNFAVGFMSHVVNSVANARYVKKRMNETKKAKMVAFGRIGFEKIP